MRIARIMLTLTIALVIAVSATAQEKKKKKAARVKLSPTAQVFLRMDRLRTALEEIDLTAEQEEELKQIREDHGPKMKEIFEKMREILTEEQRIAVEEAAKKAKEAGKKGRALFVAIEASLKLTDEQEEKMGKLTPELTAIQRKASKEIRAVLTPEQNKELQKKLQPQRKKKDTANEKKKEGQ